MQNFKKIENSKRIYCKRCLETIFRPGQKINEEGLCRACAASASTDGVDWVDRRQRLDKIAADAAANARGPYDCIIGVSGGKDSLRQARIAKEDLGLRPLLVCLSYPPEQLNDRGAQNLSNLISRGYDIHFVSPSPQTWKKMMRLGFEEFGQWTRSTELALYCSVVRVAVAMEISLCFLGENPSQAFGAESGSQDENASGFRQYDTLSNGAAEFWEHAGISREKLFWYDIPSVEVCDEIGLKMIYLGYFFEDFNDTHNTILAANVGFNPRVGDDADPKRTGSINPYESVDEDFVHVNQYLKSVKLGFGKVIQQVSVKIRNGEMTRAEGIEIVKSYDGRIGNDLIEKFCAYLEIDREKFDQVTDKLRNNDIWRKNNRGEWKHKYVPMMDYDDSYY